MEFYITIKQGYRLYRLLVKQCYLDKRIEQFEVVGRNKVVTLQSNRPYFRNKGLMHRRPDWSIVGGKLDYAGALGTLAEAIMGCIEPPLKRL